MNNILFRRVLLFLAINLYLMMLGEAIVKFNVIEMCAASMFIFHWFENYEVLWGEINI